MANRIIGTYTEIDKSHNSREDSVIEANSVGLRGDQWVSNVSS